MDLGLYYRPPLDVTTLGRLARDLAGSDAQVTAPGQWGPWVDGGGWLTIDGTAVDWIYRDLDRVHRSWHQAQVGEVVWHAQTGHPLGVPSFAYAGEAALDVVLADPGGDLTPLHRAARDYPPRLRAAVVESLAESEFIVGGARKAAPRGDSAYVAGCLFRAVGLCAHAAHAAAGRWVVNEKGLWLQRTASTARPRGSANASTRCSPRSAGNRGPGAGPGRRRAARRGHVPGLRRSVIRASSAR